MLALCPVALDPAHSRRHRRLLRALRVRHPDRQQAARGQHPLRGQGGELPQGHHPRRPRPLSVQPGGRDAAKRQRLSLSPADQRAHPRTEPASPGPAAPLRSGDRAAIRVALARLAGQDLRPRPHPLPARRGGAVAQDHPLPHHGRHDGAGGVRDEHRPAGGPAQAGGGALLLPLGQGARPCQERQAERLPDPVRPPLCGEVLGPRQGYSGARLPGALVRHPLHHPGTQGALHLGRCPHRSPDQAQRAG
ncbi:hypothetical protein D3C85_1014070 [compost metagenome]